MNEYKLCNGGKAATFSDPESFLTRLEPLLGLGNTLTIQLPTIAVDALRGIRGLLAKNKIKVVLLAGSEPQAMDYVAQTLFGGAVGAVAGAVGGVWSLNALARFGYLVPGIGWYLSAFALLGLATGAATGLAVTRMGLRVQFVHDDMLQIDVVPLQT